VAPALMARGEVAFLLGQRAPAPFIGAAASPCTPTAAEAGVGSKTSAGALGRGVRDGPLVTSALHAVATSGATHGKHDPQDTLVCARPREGAPAWEGARWPGSRGWW
jgi:hypothetical protein